MTQARAAIGDQQARTGREDRGQRGNKWWTLVAAKLGVVREGGVLLAALDRLIPAGLLPGAPPNPVSPTMSLTVTVVVIAAWAVIPLAAGAWRTTTRDA